jgi:amino acid adenylation domain-containing protein
MSKQNVEDIYPLSASQQGMLFHLLFSGDKGQVYFDQYVSTLAGELDLAVWRQAWNRVLERHPALRTQLVWERREQPLQIVRRDAVLPWQELDWLGVPLAEREERLATFLNEDHDRGFDLAKPPLTRVAMIRWEAGVHKLVWSFHHLVVDGWSMGLILADVFAFYAALLKGEEPRLAPPRPYRDYITWTQKQNPAQAEEFWRRTLAGFTAATPLPFDGSGAGGDPAGWVAREEALHAPAELAVALKTFARRHQVTLNTVVQGAWSLLLGSFGDGNSGGDVVFGGIVSGRPPEIEGVESMVGLFINLLPVRVENRPEATVAAWLKAIQEQQIEQRDYEHSPLDQVMAWSEVGRKGILFESVLVFENYPVDALRQGEAGSDLEIREVHLSESGNFPLTLYAMPGEDRLTLRINYHWTRLSAEAARRILARTLTLLERIVAHPESRVGTLLEIGAEERREILAAGRGAARTDVETTIDRLFAAQAARTPDAPAVATTKGDGTLTYGQLAARAGTLARHLRSLGVGPESVVALCVERSPEMVVGMLGVLQAGGAYLPLDPNYPAERMAFMLADSGARIVLAQERTAGRLPERLEDTGAKIVRLDADWAEVENTAAGNGEEMSSALPQSPAYVIYTSGSTGRPKGVLVPHSALTTYVRSAVAQYAITPADRVLQFASVSFDTSAEEIYPCLAAGGALVLRDEAMIGSLDGFLREIERLRISVLDLPTAFWHELAAEMDSQGLGAPAALRLVILGGEEALPERLAAWRRRVGERVRLVNTYGPTEATIVSTLFDLTAPAETAPPQRIAIGRAVANARTYVVGRDLELRAAGTDGELWLGGAGLARGYLGRPDLTAERFVPNPFAPADGAAPGERLYRTGDVARLRLDGELEFRGRFDHQVKVRGFRIELGEIEAALRRLDGVRDAVVALHGENAEKRLVAWVVPADRAVLQTGDLRAALKGSLPDYMLPASFVVIEVLPLNASGKLDRKALPAPAGRPDLDADYVAPRNPIQEVLVDLWSELLGVDRIGVEDDFFQLGGHSLLVAKLAARVRQVFQVELSLVEVFKKPTVSELAEAIEKAERGSAESELPELPPIRIAPRDRPIPLSFPQERVWFLNRLTAGGNIAYNFQFTLWLQGDLDVGAFRAATEEIVRRHEVLRTSFPDVDGRPVQVIHPTMAVDMPLIDLVALPEEIRKEESERLVFKSTQVAFDIARIPLLRWRLLRLDADLHMLIQVEHHFVHDGWSFGVLLREMKALYAAFAAGQPSPLPALPIQYADFAAWQRGWMEGPVMDKIMAYWRQKLAGATTFLELPTDRPRLARGSFKGDITIFPVPPKLYDSLRKFGRAQGFTLYMTMLSGFFALLSRYTGQEDILLGTNNANRRAKETETLLGMIVNSLVIRGDMTGDPDFRAMLGRVRETSLENYVYQDTPFERLVQEIRPERQLGRNPLFQVMFNFHDAAIPDLEFGGLKGVFLVRGNRSAKMDMNVIMVPRAEQRVGLQASAADLHAVFHWEYNSDLFDFTTILRMIDHFQTLLAGAVANPNLRLSELPLLTEAERRQTLIDWNDTAEPEPAAACLHELFEATRRRTPDAVAVSCEGRSLTYDELDARAETLAARLRGLGVGPEVLVGVSLQRSLDLPAALLAVLKAGGAYVPLDPSYPQERLAFVLADGQVAVLITERALRENLPASAAQVVEIEEAYAPTAAFTGLAATAENAAYVIYTSGSTGRPKGVEVRHRGAVNFLGSMARRPGLAASDVLLAVTTVSFDIAVLEIFLPLAVGARVELAGRDVAADGARLAALIESSGATAMQATPATWKLLLEAGWPGKPGLKALCGGEGLPADLARELLARVGVNGSLWNLYGPTETTVWSALKPVTALAAESPLVPIGRPIANTAIHLLDRNLEPVPAGIHGELYIGGEGLARGYLRRPELTAERFVPDGVGARSGARLYRTGDLARYLADGTLEFLGRADHQVKVRGFRIEPGEVEAALAKAPGVREAVVLAREDRAGDRRLVAYVVPSGDNGEAPKAEDLRGALGRTLPSYMVPGVFVFLDRLPLTPNGKVDRKALPAPELSRSEGDQDYLAPRTPVETSLAEIWAEVLGIERVGVRDDFFALGGHSLKATSVLARVRDVLRADLPLSVVFERRTIEGMASAVDAAVAAETEIEQSAAAMSDAELDALLGSMLAEEKHS